jgi:hypothetical protein
MTNLLYRGRTVTSLGVLFDFKGNSANTTVQAVADMVKEQWVSTSIYTRDDVSNVCIIQVCGSHRRGTKRIRSGWVCSITLFAIFSDTYN